MPDPRLDQTRDLIALLGSWQLGAAEISALLQLPAGVRPRQLGRVALSDHPETARRADYLLRIEAALRTSFPRSPEMRRHWVRRASRQFARRAPLQVMLEDGEPGLIAVLSHLDCTFAWDLTGSRSDYQRLGDGD
ncbi:antitoxin Xre/MbcA/ParS toxin-binding domain-containing protein [Marichromatium sp. AB32]|uniref:antitoxin Xre/MbcA/ParS toxin-binding domain-containing protein n=1 Tax=Marichromatium sp. AB32 TaxID=2483363 RepID=UPI000F3BF10B|nr:antitoxin Xre/MbcA/ParS toxin-binding domain-containing protein [Marichromatium sp. AB32]RNE94151.1 DUF2384 domain-containing protein [Marichromatium sp. AB32]